MDTIYLIVCHDVQWYQGEGASLPGHQSHLVSTHRYQPMSYFIVFIVYPKNQCCGSMKFWYGSGSADPYLSLMDPDSNADPDPAIFVNYLQDVNKKLLFFCLFLFGGTFTSFFKDKKS